MVKLKNYNVAIKGFVLFLTFAALCNCAPKKNHITRVEGREIPITADAGEDPEIAKFITPYREHIDRQMSQVLSFAAITFDKTGKWQTPIGNLFADATLLKSSPVFEKREHKKVDFCLLNAGGVRSIIPQGKVTRRTAFELMPFENSVAVVEMREEQILEMLQYIISEKKPHPISGLRFSIDKDGKPTDIFIGEQAFDKNRTYYVATNDYLYNGGDRMLFFKKGGAKYDLDYKLRDMLIDYFLQHDTLREATDIRITDKR